MKNKILPLAVYDKNTHENKNVKIGIIGGGQLGLMLAQAAAQFAVSIHIFTPDPQSPALRFCTDFVCADYDDTDALCRFAEKLDLVTYEFENISLQNLKIIEKKTFLRPNAKAIEFTQDRKIEKQFIQNIGLKTANFIPIDKNIQTDIQADTQAAKILKILKLPLIAKIRKYGYDGKGQTIITNYMELLEYIKKNAKNEVIVEEKIDFTFEASVVIARDIFADCQAYPPVQNFHEDGILKKTLASGNIDHKLQGDLIAAAKKICIALDYVGVMAVEFFVSKENIPQKYKILVNEIAPRVHNSGHWTQDCCDISQFAQHIRCITGLKAIKPQCSKGGMINLIGDDIHKASEYLNKPNQYLHLYGKTQNRKKRKMAHVNFRENNS